MSKVVNEARQQLIAAINAAKPGLKEFKIEFHNTKLIIIY